MQKLTHINDSEFEQPSWITQMGDFNSFPQPFSLINESEYIQLMFRESLKAFEYRQVHLAEWKTVRNAYIFWKDTYGLAVVEPAFWGFHSNTGKIYYIEDILKEPILYFRIGCNHKYEQVDVPRQYACDHTERCTLCGYTHSYSSDG